MATKRVCDKFRSSTYSTFSLLLICLASCCPLFKNPLPPARELKADPHILGTWTRTFKIGEHESKDQLSIFQRSTGWIDAVYIYDIRDKGDGPNLLVFEGYNVSVGKDRFLCLRLREKDFKWARAKDEKQSGNAVGGQALLGYWIIVNYEAPNNKTLIIRQFSSRKVEELIDKNELKGIVEEDWFTGQFSGSGTINGQHLEGVFDAESLKPVTVTSTSDELVKVISREGVRAFVGQGKNDVLVFSRGVAD